MVPGDGDIPLERVIGNLLDAGYTGRFDIEMLGPHIEAEGYESAVPRAVGWLSTTLDRLGA
jgi:sugar phosphate isomerase/epimerase